MRLLTMLILVAVLASLGVQVYAQTSPNQESSIISYDGLKYTRLPKGLLLGGSYYRFFDFDEYSNASTGVAIASTLYNYAFWRAGSRVVSGTEKVMGGVVNSGAIELDTGHNAQNDIAELVFANACFSTSKGITLEWRWKDTSAANTNHLIELGLTDNGTAQNSAIFRITNGAIAIVYETANGGEVSATLTNTAGIGTWYVYRLELLEGTGYTFYINGVMVKRLTDPAAVSTIAANVATLVPTFMVKVTDAGHAATKTIDIDWVRIEAPR